MEDMFYPLHMWNMKGFGDVAIPVRQSNGASFNSTTTVVPNDFKNSVLKMHEGGTGFLISISEIQINGVLEKVGLMLTAAHVVLDLHECRPKMQAFKCKLNGEKQMAYLVKEFVSDTTEDHPCISTNSSYCLPGDVAVLFVTLNKARTYDFYHPLLPTNGANCYIPGFPSCPQNLKYCIPNRNSTNDELKKVANNIFCNFAGIVYSHGEIVNCNEKIVEISCSTTSGMSGSPILSQGMYIGVYVGGPALPGQKELMDAIRLIESAKYSEAFDTLSSTLNYEIFYDDPVFYNLLTYHAQLLGILSKVQKNIQLTSKENSELEFVNRYPNIKKDNLKLLMNSANDLLYKLVWTYKDRLNYIANIGISYRNNIFRRVDTLIQGFLSCSNSSFANIHEAISYINSFI